MDDMFLALWETMHPAAIGGLVGLAITIVVIAIVFGLKAQSPSNTLITSSTIPLTTLIPSTSSTLLPTNSSTLLVTTPDASTTTTPTPTTTAPADPYVEVRKAIKDVIDDPNYVDSTYAPLFLRLAWHSSGTFSPTEKPIGGSCGGTMRHPTELNRSQNRGLSLAVARLRPVKSKFPTLSHADLFTLAGVVAIEHMGGPKIPFTGGRVDKPVSEVPPDKRLPDEKQGAAHVKQIFSRMGFTLQETVALIGAHSMGKMHHERSGIANSSWGHSTTTFNNAFFVNLVNMKWTRKRLPDASTIYVSENDTFTMLRTDMSLLEDAGFRPWTLLYAKDNEKWKADFVLAFSKLISNGCRK